MARIRVLSPVGVVARQALAVPPLRISHRLRRGSGGLPGLRCTSAPAGIRRGANNAKGALLRAANQSSSATAGSTWARGVVGRAKASSGPPSPGTMFTRSVVITLVPCQRTSV